MGVSIIGILVVAGLVIAAVVGIVIFVTASSGSGRERE
jgi:high-affinity Fe2+/Pb2+ permease